MKRRSYPIYTVSLLSVPPEVLDEQMSGPQTPEQMGSKAKFWIHSVARGGDWLVKFPRKNEKMITGEHWSEKIAAEVAAALQVPHPRVELGTFDDRPVSLTKSFISPGESLIHGNELLFLVDSEYPKDDTLGARKHTRTREHTLATIKDGLLTHGVGVDKDLSHTGLTAFGIFVGYLLLDALICNTDRHHENWAAIAQGSGSNRVLRLAPSYDHASSLGRELVDAKRSTLLTTNDMRGDLASYCERALSALFPEDRTSKPLACLEAYKLACDLDPAAAQYWKQVINRIEGETLSEIVERVPERMMTAKAKEFTAGLLTLRLRILQDLK